MLCYLLTYYLELLPWRLATREPDNSVTVAWRDRLALPWDRTGCEFDFFQCRIGYIYSMFIESTITWVPSGFSGYIYVWLDTRIVLKKSRSGMQCDSKLRTRSTIAGSFSPMTSDLIMYTITSSTSKPGYNIVQWLTNISIPPMGETPGSILSST